MPRSSLTRFAKRIRTARSIWPAAFPPMTSRLGGTQTAMSTGSSPAEAEPAAPCVMSW